MRIVVYLNGNRRTDVPTGDLTGKEEFHLERGTVHLFTKEDAKAKWLNSSGYAVYYQRGLAMLAQMRRETATLKRQEKSVAHAIELEEAAGRKAVLRLLAKHKVTPDNSSQFKRILADYVPGTRSAPLSTFLFDGPAYTGTWKYLRHGIQIPKLSWINFNDRTTSLRVFGETTVLCRHTWWHGTRAWFGGYPYWEEDLSGRWWNNRASSVFSF